MELLEMQWYLQRLVAMSGAAGWPSLNRNDDYHDIIRCLNPSYADSKCEHHLSRRLRMDPHPSTAA